MTSFLTCSNIVPNFLLDHLYLSLSDIACQASVLLALSGLKVTIGAVFCDVIRRLGSSTLLSSASFPEVMASHFSNRLVLGTDGSVRDEKFGADALFTPLDIIKCLFRSPLHLLIVGCLLNIAVRRAPSNVSKGLVLSGSLSAIETTCP